MFSIHPTLSSKETIRLQENEILYKEKKIDCLASLKSLAKVYTSIHTGELRLLRAGRAQTAAQKDPSGETEERGGVPPSAPP